MSARAPRWILALTMALGLGHIAQYLLPFEDAFITYRYSHNLAAGFGLVHNLGERVEGYTSFTWTLLLSAVSAAGLPIATVSQMLSTLFGLATLWLSALIVRSVRQSLKASESKDFTLGDVIPSLLIACSGTFAYYAASGMETMLFLALLLTAMNVLCQVEAPVKTSSGQASPDQPSPDQPSPDQPSPDQPSPDQPSPDQASPARTSPGQSSSIALGVLLALAAMTRPEGMGYGAVIGGILVTSKRHRNAFFKTALTGLAIFVPYTVWRYNYFGFWFPNTYYAKAQLSWPLVLRGIRHAEGVLIGQGGALTVLLLVVQTWRLRNPKVWLILVVALFSYLNIVLVGGDVFPYWRFALPALVCGAMAVGIEINFRLAQTVNSNQTQRIAMTAGATLAALVFGLGRLPLTSFTWRRQRSEHETVLAGHRINQVYFEIGDALASALPQGSTIALNAIGIIPFRSGFTTIDMLGLTDVHIAHRPITLGGRNMVGHEKHDAAYVLSRRPTAILLHLPFALPPGTDIDQAIPALMAAYRNNGFTADQEMLEQADFHRWYDLAILRVASGSVPFFVRRQTPRTTPDESH